MNFNRNTFPRGGGKNEEEGFCENVRAAYRFS